MKLSRAWALLETEKATPAPSGLTIVRDGNKFTLSWKIPSCKFEKGQQLRYRLKESGKWSGWTDIKIGTTTTAKSVTVSSANYYPAAGKTKHLEQLEFEVRGKGKKTREKSKQITMVTTYTWSSWSSKTYDVKKPNKPELSAALESTYLSVFSWTTETSDKSAKWFKDVKWETILVKNCSEKDGSKLKWNSERLGWDTGTGTASGNEEITENSALLAGASYTRWFRILARGPEGHTDWVYEKHVYATPNRAKIKEASAKDDASGGLTISVKWTASATEAKPIDSTIVQYKFAIPESDMSCPPGDTGWTDAVTQPDTAKSDAAKFTISGNTERDHCLYVRVNTEHDGDVMPGIPELVKIGKLKDPSEPNATPNQSTHRVLVEAENNSDVDGSFLAVVFRRSKKPGKDYVCGIIEADDTSTTVQCPDWGDSQIAFAVFACVGSYKQKQRSDGADAFAVERIMTSAKKWGEGSVPMAPDVTAKATKNEGTVRVEWDWTWEDADEAEISWSDHEDAWESTDQPSTYRVANTYAAEWNIHGLATGKTWYVRVRLISGETYGPYSDAQAVDLADPPFTPVLTLSDGIIKRKGRFTAYWDYVSGDGTGQSYAVIREVFESGGTYTFGDRLAKVLTAQHADIKAPKRWLNGETHLLRLKVFSESQKGSDWSDPVPIIIAPPAVAAITSHTLETIEVSADDEEEETREVLALTEMPLGITVTGAGEGGTTTLIIERAENYRVERPDETEREGFEGETVCLITQLGENPITVTKEDLIGLFDDGAPYRIRAIAKDGYGQSDEKQLEFEVHWQHQALMPIARELLHGSVIQVTPIAPEGAETGDVCDIYRLSADRPVLIAENVEFGETIVDPYPAIGDAGGHRVVFKTANGDYITEESVIAWYDMADEFDTDCAIIDFAGEQVVLKYDLSFSNQWKKEFTETKYLGGAVTGDWAPGASRTMSLSGVLVTVDDDETIEALRRLAVYDGICHVRTQDGSSISADVQVSEQRTYQNAGRKVAFSLSITRVDPEGLDGIALEVWEER